MTHLLRSFSTRIVKRRPLIERLSSSAAPWAKCQTDRALLTRSLLEANAGCGALSIARSFSDSRNELSNALEDLENTDDRVDALMYQELMEKYHLKAIDTQHVFVIQV